MTQKILVVEDETIIRRNLARMLGLEGFQVFEAENGLSGVKQAQTELPDLILCDINMPELDGYGVLNALREDVTTCDIPFIFLTGRSEKFELRQGMNLGADDYLTKPFTRDELMGAVTSRLNRHRQVIQPAEKRLEELRENLTRALPHEFTTPISLVMMYSELLSEQAESLEPKRVKEIAHTIRHSSQRLNKLIQDFLLYAELEVIAVNPAKIQELRKERSGSVKEIIELAATGKAQETHREADLQIKLDETSLAISGRRLKKLVEEIIDNAFRYSEKATSVEISGKADQNEGSYTLTIKDRGRGMTAEQLNQVGAYVQFERKLYEQQGLGLGLSLAKRLTELHAGTLKISSTPQEETVVTVNLPLYPKPGTIQTR
jgi:signal transduction histidine kinase